MYRGRALPKSAFALTELFESGGRSWGLTTDYIGYPTRPRDPGLTEPVLGRPARSGREPPVAFVRKQGEAIVCR